MLLPQAPSFSLDWSLNTSSVNQKCFYKASQKTTLRVDIPLLSGLKGVAGAIIEGNFPSLNQPPACTQLTPASGK